MLSPLIFAAALALQAAPPAAAHIATFSDEFDGPELARDWTMFHLAYGWPNKIKVIDVGAPTGERSTSNPTIPPG